MFPVPVGKRGKRIQDVEVTLDESADTRTQHLDDDFRAIVQSSGMYLRDRCRRKWLVIKAGKHFAN